MASTAWNSANARPCGLEYADRANDVETVEGEEPGSAAEDTGPVISDDGEDVVVDLEMAAGAVEK